MSYVISLVQQLATATVMINLLDVNDNAPVFTMAEYMGSIQEDSDEENLVAEVDAADPDTVGTFSYSIESGMSTASEVILFFSMYILWYLSHSYLFCFKLRQKVLTR